MYNWTQYKSKPHISQFLGLPTSKPVISARRDRVSYAKKMAKLPPVLIWLYSWSALSMPKPEPSSTSRKNLTYWGSHSGLKNKLKNNLKIDSYLQLSASLQIPHHQIYCCIKSPKGPQKTVMKLGPTSSKVEDCTWLKPLQSYLYLKHV